MRDLISSSVGPTIDLHLRHDPELPSALIDPNQLELALLNLCVNARDAMPNGGPLTILAEEVAIGPRSSPKLKPGLYVRLSVIDAGSGMDSETLARAVEPFYSTKEFGRGTGLGLSMVHGLAAQLGGAFELTSAPGEGTRVDLYLPVADEVAPDKQRPHPDGMPAIGSRLCVLLIDDEELVRTATAEMIRDLGHSVVEASGAAEALARLDRGLKADVVVSDYKMPGIDGGEVARRIARTHPEIPVLLITGYAGPAEDMMDLPRLAKPFGQADIAAALAGLFAPDDKILRFPARTTSA
jgi:CheY-like chemotaxis protein